MTSNGFLYFWCLNVKEATHLDGSVESFCSRDFSKKNFKNIFFSERLQKSCESVARLFFRIWHDF